MAPLPAGIRVDVSVSCPGGQPGEELRADPLLVSLEKWTESCTWGPTDCSSPGSFWLGDFRQDLKPSVLWLLCL